MCFDVYSITIANLGIVYRNIKPRLCVLNKLYILKLWAS